MNDMARRFVHKRNKPRESAPSNRPEKEKRGVVNNLKTLDTLNKFLNNNDMPLRIIHESGVAETISICFPAVFGRGKVLNKLVCADGVEYFFTKEGYYDGYGRDVEVTDLVETQ